MSRRSLAGKRALITGASSGIGEALARAFARKGASLIITARREDKLAQLRKDVESLWRDAPNHGMDNLAVHAVPGDVTEASTRTAVLDVAAKQLGGLDILVNNAGISALGRFAEASAERMRRIMEVNFFAAAELTRAAIPMLADGVDPIVVNIGSILGRRGAPWNSEYCASKFALSGWSESIRPEFERLGVDMLLVSPGTTDTEFFSHLIEKQGDAPWPEQKGAPVSTVADSIVRAIERGNHEIIPSGKGRLLVWLNRLSPRLADRLMGRWG